MEKDFVKENYNRLYFIFKKCDGASGFRIEKVLEILIITSPLAYFVFDHFYPKYSLVNNISFLFVFLFSFITYYKIICNRNKITNLFTRFDAECINKKIDSSMIENYSDYLNVIISKEKLFDFCSPMILTVILSIAVNIIYDFLKDESGKKLFADYSFIIPLFICIYLIAYFVFGSRNRELLLFRECLIHTKINNLCVKIENKCFCNNDISENISECSYTGDNLTSCYGGYNMTENKKNILVFSIVSIILLFSTYFLSVCLSDFKYLKRDFLLAITSGVFASSFVVLFSEFVKYNMNKKNIQNALYANLRELYRQFVSQEKYASHLIENPKREFSENVFSANAPIINKLVTSIKFLQYDTFFKNHFFHELFYFQQNEIVLLDKYISACAIFPQKTFLEIKLKKAKQGNLNYYPSVNDEKILQLISTLRNESEKWCKTIDKLICILDKTCKYRFLWKKDKSVIDSFKFLAENESIYDFLNKQ